MDEHLLQSDNAADLGDDAGMSDWNEKAQRAQLVAQVMAEARATIERLRDYEPYQPPLDNVIKFAPRPEPPEPPKPEQSETTQAIIAALREETRQALDYHRSFTSELLIQLVGDLRGEFCGEVDEAAKAFNSDLRELRSAIAEAGGRSRGESESLRDELRRSKAEVEELKAEIKQLRVDLDKAIELGRAAWDRIAADRRMLEIPGGRSA